MAKIKRNCNNCKKEYEADERNLKRGWGLNCSKSCAASSREKSKPGYSKERVARNNVRRKNWGEENKERWARRRGYPSFDDYERESFDDDGGWDSHGGSVGICNICDLRFNYCRCGEGADEIW